jgi:hypothetical protein
VCSDIKVNSKTYWKVRSNWIINEKSCWKARSLLLQIHGKLFTKSIKTSKSKRYYRGFTSELEKIVKILNTTQFKSKLSIVIESSRFLLIDLVVGFILIISTWSIWSERTCVRCYVLTALIGCSRDWLSRPEAIRSESIKVWKEKTWTSNC